MKKYNGEEGGLLLFFVVLFELDLEQVCDRGTQEAS
jgi:hypothetical protein